MRHQQPAPLVRLHVDVRRDHVHRLARLAGALARRKGRSVCLGEALELSLSAGHAWTDLDLLDLSRPDREEPQWLELGSVG